MHAIKLKMINVIYGFEAKPPNKSTTASVPKSYLGFVFLYITIRKPREKFVLKSISKLLFLYLLLKQQ